MGLQVHISLVGLGFLVFGFFAFLVALGGVGAANAECHKTTPAGLCARDYQWEWWSLWFEFAMLVAILVCSFLERAWRRGRLVFLCFLQLSTICTMLSAHNFLVLLSLSAINFRDLRQSAINGAAAGYVLLAIVNWVLIIVIGVEPDFGAGGAGAGVGLASSGLTGSANPFDHGTPGPGAL